MKSDFVKAYMYEYGATKKEALEAWKRAAQSYIDELIALYKGQSRKAFYED